MRFLQVMLTGLIAMLPLLGFTASAQAGSVSIVMGGHIHSGHSHIRSGHSHGYHGRNHRLRPGFALSYGVAGTNIGHSRHFEKPRSHTYGSVPSRLAPRDFHSRSVKPRHRGHSRGHSRGHFPQHSNRYRHGYHQGYRDGFRDSRPARRNRVGP